jgi:hypothetical protein
MTQPTDYWALFVAIAVCHFQPHRHRRRRLSANENRSREIYFPRFFVRQQKAAAVATTLIYFLLYSTLSLSFSLSLSLSLSLYPAQ